MTGALAHNQRIRRFPRGTVYIAVLALAMLALVIGLGGMMASRVRARLATQAAEASEARFYARSAIEMGRAWIAADPAWRSARGGGAWITSAPFGSGTISLEVSNPLGALNRSTLDPVVLTATGTRGAARQKLRVTLGPSPGALSCLTPVLCCGGSLTLDGCVLDASGLTVSSNGNVVLKSGGATMNANVEASGTASGATYAGTKAAGRPAKQMPTIATVVNEYTSVGSAVPWAGVPIVSGDRTFENMLISPSSPPFGAAPQASGVYVLDCKNSLIVMKNVRVAGTIVLLNCGGLSMRGSVFMEPAVTNYPCLIVQGNLGLDFDAHALEENSAKVNLNPGSTPWPYPSGVSNTTQLDSYPCSIAGLVFVSGDFTVNKKEWMLGPTIVGGTATITEDLAFFPCPQYASSPPPGFADVKMTPTLWEQAVD